MTFPFLQLPPEIRNKVYRLLLVTKHPNQHIFPDVNGTARRMRLSWIYLPDMGDSLSLLVTCKLVNQEASAVLYGCNKYLFDDRPYTSGETGIPACDFTYLYSWLRHIGAENRKRLQWIQLHFRTPVFCYCWGERVTRTQTQHTGAPYLIKVFELLERGHGLQYLKLEFESMHKQTQNEQLYRHLFRVPGNSQLISQMTKIHGLQELQIFVGKVKKRSNGRSKGDAVFSHVKEQMEEKTTIGERSTMQEVSKLQTLAGRITELEEKCDALKKTALRTNQQWRTEVRQVKEIENTLSKIQAAVSEHLQPGPPS